MTAMSQQRSAPPKIQAWGTKMGPGLIFCAAFAVVAYFLEQVEKQIVGHAVIDALVIALVIGIAIRNVVKVPKSLDFGAKYASKQVLEASVFLLGASVAFGKIINTGGALFALITFSVVGGFTFTWLIGRFVFRLPSKLAVLVGVGQSICGNSAVAAAAPAIGATADDVAAAIGIGAVLGVGQIILLPLLVPGLDLTHYQYGVVAGLAVYAVPQVVAAAFTVSNLSGQVATLVKLVRVLFLGPIIVGLRVVHPGQAVVGSSLMARIQSFVPWFVGGFVLLAVLRSSGVISDSMGSDAQAVSKWLFIISMVGLGLGVDLKSVRAVGPKVAGTVFCSILFMLLVSLVGTSLLGITG